MRYIIAGSIAFALVAGIALGFVLRGGAFEAEAKPPPPEPAGGRTIVIAEGVTIDPKSSFVSGIIDVADCDALAVFADHDLSGKLIVRLQLSADGTTVSGIAGGSPTLSPGTGHVNYFTVLGSGIPIVTPKVAVELFNDLPFDPGNIAKAWLFCSQ